MDSKEFYQRLDELCVWRRPKPKTDSSIRTDKNHVEEIIRFDSEQGQEVINISMKENRTLPIEILSFKGSKTCDDCGRRNANNRVVSIKKREYPNNYWNRSCNICKKHYNPLTNEFDASVSTAGNHWVSYFKKINNNGE